MGSNNDSSVVEELLELLNSQDFDFNNTSAIISEVECKMSLEIGTEDDEGDYAILVRVKRCGEEEDGDGEVYGLGAKKKKDCNVVGSNGYLYLQDRDDGCEEER
ncbi:hypothetical protein Ancab_001736 [Ancistrocladus abbreviatus]